MLLIRHLEDSDYHQVVDLLTQLTSIDKSNISKESFRKFVLNQQNNGYHNTYVMTKGNTVVGTATLLIEPKLIHDMGFVGHIEDVVVDLKERNTGMGKLIIENLTKIADEKGCYKVILDCDETNVGFYEKCGLQKKGVEMAMYF